MRADKTVMQEIGDAPRARKTPAVSPTQRTLKKLRGMGFIAEIVEHWNAFAHIRQDLFGFADIAAVRQGELWLVKTTTDTGRSARRHKLAALEKARLCAGVPGAQVLLWTWGKHDGDWVVHEERMLEDGTWQKVTT